MQNQREKKTRFSKPAQLNSNFQCQWWNCHRHFDREWQREIYAGMLGWKVMRQRKDEERYWVGLLSRGELFQSKMRKRKLPPKEMTKYKAEERSSEMPRENRGGRNSRRKIPCFLSHFVPFQIHFDSQHDLLQSQSKEGERRTWTQIMSQCVNWHTPRARCIWSRAYRVLLSITFDINLKSSDILRLEGREMRGGRESEKRSHRVERDKLSTKLTPPRRESHRNL